MNNSEEKTLMASSAKKRGQHYVWRKYLEAWEVGGKLWVLRNGKTYQSAAQGTAKERDFYRLVELTQDELAFVRRIAIDLTKNPFLRKANEGWLESLQMVFQARDVLMELGMSRASMEQVLDVPINNIEEDLHGFIETSAVPFIASLRARDLSFYDDEKSRASFTHYLSLQLLRTKRNQQRFTESFQADYGDRLRLDACWSLIRHMFATNIGGMLFAQSSRYRPVILRNHTPLPFITGDQPVINTFAIGKAATEEIPDTELYYPVDPTTAILLGSSRTGVRELDISEEEARFYNDAIREASYEQIFSSEEAALLAKPAPPSK